MLRLAVTLHPKGKGGILEARPAGELGADIPLRSNSARMTRRCSLAVCTRPGVCTVTGSFAAAEEASLGTDSEPRGAIMALVAMTPMGIFDQRCYG
jgi:hypothetical protein